MKGKQKLVKRLKRVKKVDPKNVDLTKLKLSELRKLFPHIKAISAKEFLEELAKEKEKDVQVKD
jgi:hypothetical protein